MLYDIWFFFHSPYLESNDRHNFSSCEKSIAVLEILKREVGITFEKWSAFAFALEIAVVSLAISSSWAYAHSLHKFLIAKIISLCLSKLQQMYPYSSLLCKDMT